MGMGYKQQNPEGNKLEGNERLELGLWKEIDLGFKPGLTVWPSATNLTSLSLS